jgi:glutamate dehydrogenase
VQDWQAMQDSSCARSPRNSGATHAVAGRRRAEAQEFLRWAADDHFTFLGYREYEVVRERWRRRGAAWPMKTAGMGLLQGKDSGAPRLLKSLAATACRKSGPSMR